jgi:hypothetical protein
MSNDDQKETMNARLQALSTIEFLALGMDGLAYIRPLGLVDDVETYTVCAADGTHIATGPDAMVLKAIANQQNLTAMSIQ